METLGNLNRENIERPKYLYLGTQVSGITELEPRRGNFRDKGEGAVIFATPDIALASMFLIKGHNDSWTRIGYLNRIPYVAIKANQEKFIKEDRGGVMYTVPSDTFNFDVNKGMGKREWTSRVPVKPTQEIKYTSAVDIMIKNGVQVYFVDEKTFNNMIEDMRISGNILGTLVSENQRRGQNIRPFE